MGRQIKVGLFVLFTLSLVGAAIFLIGANKRFWDAKVGFKTSFNDVAGLKAGAPVRSGGIDVGSVTSVGHAADPHDTRIYVTIDILKAEAARIHEDTIARVVNKGLLGDKMLELTVSIDGVGAALPPGSLLKSEEPRDMFAAANDLAGGVKNVIEKLQPLAKQLGDPVFTEDIKGTAAAVHRILEGIATNDSIIHRVMMDPDEGKRFHALVTNLNEMTTEVHGILRDVHDVTTETKSGKGLVGALLNDPKMKDSVAGTLAEVHTAMRAINDEANTGVAHAVLYGDKSTQGLMANFTAISSDIRDIVSGIRRGKGTIGALLVDPSIYEDIKSAIGNVERNQVLRALVRYSIKADEARPHVETPRVEPQAASGQGTSH